MKHIAAAFFAFFAFTLCALHPALAGQPAFYNDGAAALEGYWAPSACGKDKAAPLVLIAHQWKGLTDYEKRRADMLAESCYNAFAVDVYGKGVRPQTNDEAAKESSTYKNDPALARRRMMAALNYAKTLEGVDPDKIAVLGYCFGGAMALELARSGADVEAVVTFHGALASKDPVTKPGIIKGSVLVHHGADDPFVTQDEVRGFMNEMNAAEIDWSLTEYPHAVHAFTQRESGGDASTGAAYNERADKLSWMRTMGFLKETFGQ